MAHFAQIIDGVVAQIIVVSDEDCGGVTFPESEAIGQQFIKSIGLEGEWLQTSYSGSFRRRFASEGLLYSTGDLWGTCPHGYFYATEDELRQDAWQVIKSIRLRAIFGVIPYLFPGDTKADGVQVRDEKDRSIIQDFMTQAQQLILHTTLFPEESVDYSDVKLVFVPESNTPKLLTPQEMLKIGTFLKVRGDNIYKASWVKRAEIDSAASVFDVDLFDGWEQLDNPQWVADLNPPLVEEV